MSSDMRDVGVFGSVVAVSNTTTFGFQGVPGDCHATAVRVLEFKTRPQAERSGMS